MPHTRIHALLTRFRTHRRVAQRTPNPPNPHRKQLRYTRRGGIKGGLLLWLLGVPIPLILLFFLIKGCVS